MSLLRTRQAAPNLINEIAGCKVKRLTGTTGATEGSSVDVPHELGDIDRIISWVTKVSIADDDIIAEGNRHLSEREFNSFVLNATNFRVELVAARSGSILSKPFETLIFYTD